MKNLNIDEVKPGDKTAKDIRLSDGSMVLARGSDLSESIIIRLQRMGIAELTIESDEGNTPADIDTAIEALEHRFAGHENNPLMMELKDIVKNLIAEPK